MCEEDLATPSGADGGLFDGAEVQELAAVVAGDGPHAAEEGVAGALEAVEFADDGRLRPGGDPADDFAPGHALGHDQEARRGSPRSADDGVHIPVPVFAPVLRARRTFRDRLALGVGVGHARAGVFAPLSRRPVGQLRLGHAEQPGVDRIINRPLARHPRQVAAHAQPHDGGVRRETFQQDQVAEQGGDARGQPRAGALVQGRPVRGVLRLPGRVDEELLQLAVPVHGPSPAVLAADRRAVPSETFGESCEVRLAPARIERPDQRLEPDPVLPCEVFTAAALFDIISLPHGSSGLLAAG